MITETVSGRSILRYRGEPVEHEIRWRGTHIGEANYPGGLIGECDCGQPVHTRGGKTTVRLARADYMHAGLEDPPEGDTP